MGKREIYEHLERDLDGLYYYFKNKDVQMYRSEYEDVNKIFNEFIEKSEQWLYIIGNYIYFTRNGVKYWDILTSSEWEWDNIKGLIKELSKIADDVVYVYGHLD